MAPMNKTPSEDDIASTLTHLKLSTKDPQKPLHKPKSKPVADSWDEEDDSGSATETEDNATTAPPSATTASDSSSLTSPISIGTSSDTSPRPPPPTPASPVPFDGFPDNTPYSLNGGVGGASVSAPRTNNPDKRPEKTTAVAGRLIAGALGVRAPKRTEEEREFDRVVREKERRRRAEEKERETREAEEREKRKKAVWDD
ncbi:hypothetical protein NX059_000783 [Plenodomus lindquistii]|nr:hypothetical protein NX059_000783 [Plenodomus lindquistii]